MVKRPGGTHYEEIGWDEALRLIGDQLNSLDSPDEAIFYTSGRASNEAAFLYQLFVRAYGTNNLPDCSNMCHESSGTALTESIGIGKGSVSLRDIYDAECIVIAGQNPGTNHPRMLSALEIAKRRGAKIISINPLREAGSGQLPQPAEAPRCRRQGHRHRRPAPADPAQRRPRAVPGHRLAAAGVGRHRPRVRRASHRAASTSGPSTYGPSTGTVVESATGLTRAQITEAAEMIRASDATIYCWAMGLTQHRNAVATIREVGQPRAGPRRHRQARRRAVPRARALQRAGRSHDGHLGAGARSLPRRAAGRVRLRPAARARLRHRRRDPRVARRQGRVLHGPWRQLRPGRPRHRRDGAGAAQRGHDGAGVDQAQPVAPRVRRRRPDPADHGTHREARDRRPASSSSRSRTRCRRCTHRAASCRRSARTCAPRSRSSRASPRRRSASGTASTGPPWRSTTTSSASTSHASSPGCEEYTHNVDRPGGFVLPHPAARLPYVRDQERQGRVRPVADRAPARPRGTPRAPDPAQPRPVQHHDLRAQRSLPRHRGRPPRRLHAPRRHRGTRVSPATTSSTWSRTGTATTSTRRRAVPHRLVRHPARFGRGLLSRDQPAGAARLDRHRQQPADVQVAHGPARAAPGCGPRRVQVRARTRSAPTTRTSRIASPSTCRERSVRPPALRRRAGRDVRAGAGRAACGSQDEPLDVVRLPADRRSGSQRDGRPVRHLRSRRGAGVRDTSAAGRPLRRVLRGPAEPG